MYRRVICHLGRGVSSRNYCSQEDDGAMLETSTLELSVERKPRQWSRVNGRQAVWCRGLTYSCFCRYCCWDLQALISLSAANIWLWAASLRRRQAWAWWKAWVRFCCRASIWPEDANTNLQVYFTYLKKTWGKRRPLGYRALAEYFFLSEEKETWSKISWMFFPELFLCHRLTRSH